MSAQFTSPAASSSAMGLNYYRCYLVGSDGGFGAVREAFTATDEEAIAFGREQLHAQHLFRQAEIWQQGRLVGRVSR
ncbi:MAG TPA: hypothetical protein VFN88_04435 [Caulobacteraceae bacterium]|nr:hypothetical protein [Caulobacteraceae bacterium]